MTEDTYKLWKADCEKLNKQLEVVKGYTRRDMLCGFAVKPEDLEKGLNAYDTASIMDFVELQNKCTRHDSRLVVITDAEREIVALAPGKIADLIVRLLNDSPDIDTHVII
jgi:hypothetical protein